MNTEAFKLAHDTLKTAVREYGWSRRGVQARGYSASNGYSYGPGKFEGEHWSIVHYYDAVMNGCADESLYEGERVAADLLEVDETERAAFSFAPDTAFVALWYSDQGFVSMEELTAARCDKLLEADTESQQDA